VSLAGVILAAGASSRMGTPKALLAYQGESFLDRSIRLFASVCAPVIVVVGFDADLIQSGIQRAAEATFVRNPDPARGMLSSLQTGLRHVPPGTERVLFTLVDHPQVGPATIRAIATETAPIVIPVFDGQRGHPVCIGRAVANELLELPPEASPKDVMHRHRNETCFLNAGDPGVLADIDDPESYAALLSQATPR